MILLKEMQTYKLDCLMAVNFLKVTIEDFVPSPLLNIAETIDDISLEDSLSEKTVTEMLEIYSTLLDKSKLFDSHYGRYVNLDLPVEALAALRDFYAVVGCNILPCVDYEGMRSGVECDVDQDGIANFLRDCLDSKTLDHLFRKLGRGKELYVVFGFYYRCFKDHNNEYDVDSGISHILDFKKGELIEFEKFIFTK